MREQNARQPSRRKPPRPVTAYERGLADGACNRQRPSINYFSATDLLAWWRGWKAGKTNEQVGDAEKFVERISEIGKRKHTREPKPQQWEARRAEYLRNKGLA